MNFNDYTPAVQVYSNCHNLIHPSVVVGSNYPAASYDTTYPNFLKNDQYDSGFSETPHLPEDVGSGNNTNDGHLEGWQVQMLNVWYSWHRRLASDTEIVLFRGLMRASEESIKTYLRQLLDGDNNWPVGSAIQVPDPFSEHASTMSKPRARNYNDLTPVDHAHMAHNVIKKRTELNDNLSINDNMHGISNLLDRAEVLGNASGLMKYATPDPVDETAAFKDESAPNHTTNTRKYPDTPTPSTRKSTPYELLGNMGSVTRRSGTLRAADPSQSASPFPPCALLHLVSRIIRLQEEKTCKLLPDDECQLGMYPCSFGCGHAFKNAADLFRHQAILFPQDFWFCTHCGNPEHPNAKHVFTRKDKFLKHLKSNHPDVDIGMISQFRVRGVTPKFPKRCELCLHHRHTSWEDRCKHIIRHCKDGDFLNMPSRRPPSRRELPMGDDQAGDDDGNGDDDDKDDSRDDNDDPNGPGDDPGDNLNGYTDDDPSDDPPNSDHDSSHDDSFSFGPYPDDSFDFGPFFSLESLGYPTSICLQRLPDGSQKEAKQPKTYAIQWLDRVNKKGATASVYKVALELDLDTGEDITSKHYAVKQYVSSGTAKSRNFLREVEAFTLLEHQTSRTSTSIIRCYGTFEYNDKHGRPTHNLLLEYGDCDLREYRADTSIPRSANKIIALWSSICDIAQAIHSIHNIKEHDGRHVCMRHGDLKPDNILRVGNTFKLGDLGLTRVVDSQGVCIRHEYAESGNNTRLTPDLTLKNRYLRTQHFCQSHCVPTTEAKDVWDFGHVLLSTIIWVVLGFSHMQEFEQHFPPWRNESGADIKELGLAINNLRNVIETEPIHVHAYTTQMLDYTEQLLASDGDKRYAALQLVCKFGNTLESRALSFSTTLDSDLSKTEHDCKAVPLSLTPGLEVDSGEHDHEQDKMKRTLDWPRYASHVEHFQNLPQLKPTSYYYKYEAAAPPSLASRPYSKPYEVTFGRVTAWICTDHFNGPPALVHPSLYAPPSIHRSSMPTWSIQPSHRKINLPKYHCEMAGTTFNGFSWPRDYIRHSRHHNGEKSSWLSAASGSLHVVQSSSGSMLCHWCGTGFSGNYQRGNLARHERVHHDGHSPIGRGKSMCRHLHPDATNTPDPAFDGHPPLGRSWLSRNCGFLHDRRMSSVRTHLAMVHSNLDNTGNMIPEQDLTGYIAQAIEQYLTGRQEKLWILQIPIASDFELDTYRMLRRLLSEFWHSPRRQPFRRGFQIQFVETREEAQSEQPQERYSLEHVRALTNQFQFVTNWTVRRTVDDHTSTRLVNN